MGRASHRNDDVSTVRRSGGSQRRVDRRDPCNSNVVITSPSGASFGSKARAVTITALIGVPAFAFLAVITLQAILMPLAGLLLLALLVAVNYLLWGRLLAPSKPAGGRRRGDDEVA